MGTAKDKVTRPLTLKYIFTLGLLAALAVVNFLILQAEISDSSSVSAVVNSSSRQRVLLLRTAMLSDRLVFALDQDQRNQVRNELMATIDPLEKTHHELMLPEGSSRPPSPEIQSIYEDSPWLLDSEMRNYVAHLRAIASAADGELGYDNAHYQYVRNPATIDTILNGLDAVVEVYEARSDGKTAQLRLLAIWALVSTLTVLLLDGWFVFLPMVRRVTRNIKALNNLNATLERRVAERTAEAEQRAQQLIQAERLAAIGQMVTGVAHESRNALQQIQACCKLLEWELEGDESSLELVTDLQLAQDRLHRLFDELRGYASPRKLERRECNLHEVLLTAWDALSPERGGRDARLEEHHGRVSLECYADPFQLEQVFRNILENALAAGQDPLRIDVEYRAAEQAPGIVEIAISDNGPGLSPEQQEKVFEPFFTTKTQGTGLGLAIAHQIVQAHHGVLLAGNGRQGAEFVIRLPRQPPADNVDNQNTIIETTHA